MRSELYEELCERRQQNGFEAAMKGLADGIIGLAMFYILFAYVIAPILAYVFRNG